MTSRTSPRRRSLLKLGLLGSAALAVGGYIATRLTDGSPQARLPQAANLSPASQVLWLKVIEAVLDGMLPAEAAQRQAALDATLAGLDQGIGRLVPHTQAELKDLLGMLSLAPGRAVLTGRWGSWAAASVPEVQAWLTGLRGSSMQLRRLIFLTLHDLATSSYYALPQSWPGIGYRGPIAPGPGIEV